MKSKFLDNLKTSLRGSGVKEEATNEIARVYNEYFKEGSKLGKSEKEIYDGIENLNTLVRTFAPTKVKEYKETSKAVIKEKRSLGAIAFSAVILFLLNLFLVPIILSLFLVVFTITLLPVVATVASIAVLLYGVIYVNGHMVVLSELTRWTLPFGVIGLSIIAFIVASYLYKWLFSLVAILFSWEARFLRRYK